MRIKSFILAAMALVTIAVSCEPKKPALGVTIDPKALSFSADGGTQSVKASSSDVWTVSVPDIAKEWLQVSPLSGSGEVNVTITASANPGKPRSVSVIFACGLYDATLPISQEGMQKAGDGKTLETAFSASEAHDWVLANVEAGDATPDRYFVKGIIHKMVTSDGAEQYFASNTYGNASFFISDDGQSSDQDFECFQVNYLGNRAWKKGDTDVKVGDSVTIYGYLTNYQGKNGNVAETTGKGAAYLVVLNDTVVEPVIESKADPTGSGTLEDPYNVAAAINATSKLGYTNTSTYDKIEGVYVRGVISEIKNVDTSSSFGNAEYSIVDEGYTAVFGVYRGYYLGGEKFTSADQIKVGDKVIITGAICKMFGTTPQFTTGNYIVEINGKQAPKPENVSGDVSACVAANDKDNVEVKDAIVAALSSKGYIVTDGKTNCYVYLDKEPSVKIGDKVTIKGTKTTYYGLPEFKDIKEETVASSGNEVPRTELKDVTGGIDAYNSSDTEYLSVTGKLVKDGNFYNVDVAGASRKAQASNPHSSIKLDDLVGKMVTMTGYFNTIYEAKNLLQIVVTQVAEASGDQKYCYVNPKEINVKASATEASLAITSNAKWIIDNIPEGIEVTPNEGNGDAEVKIKLSANSAQESRNYEFRVFSEEAGVEEIVKLTQEGQADASAHSVSASLKVQDGATFDFYDALVVALTTKGFVVTDGAANVYVYLNAVPTVKIGDKVDFTATFQADYYGLPEYKSAKNIKVVSSGNEVIRTSLVDITSIIDSYASGNVDYLLVKGKLEKNGNYWKVTPSGATRYASPDYMISDIDPSALENQEVRLYGYFNTIHSNGYVKVITTEILPGDENAKFCGVSTNEVKLAYNETEGSFNINSNADWTVTCDNGAFTLSEAAGSGNATIKVLCSENPDESVRSAKVVVSCPDASFEATVTVTQAAKPAAGTGSVTKGKDWLAANKDGNMDDVISYTNSSSYSSAVTELRVYKNQTFVVKAASGYKITSIQMKCSKTGTTQYGPGCWGAGAPEGYSYDGAIGTWSGEKQEVSFTAKENQVRIEELTVTYKAD